MVHIMSSLALAHLDNWIVKAMFATASQMASQGHSELMKYVTYFDNVLYTIADCTCFVLLTIKIYSCFI